MSLKLLLDPYYAICFYRKVLNIILVSIYNTYVKQKRCIPFYENCAEVYKISYTFNLEKECRILIYFFTIMHKIY